jgi:pimeloyl-ACP methyl ester carboxylesterase
MQHVIDSVELPTGVRLQYTEQGDPAGVPLLLLHGYSDSWRSFEPVLPHLPGSIRALAVTQRGHGDSSRPAAGYGTRDFAADAVALMDALGVDAAVVAGHSMGAAVAQRIALDHPERVEALVLAGGATTWAHNPAVAELAAAVAQLRDPVDPEFVREFQAGTAAEPLEDDLLDAMVAESRKLPARVWQAVMEETIRADFAPELASITAPTLIIWGDQDCDIAPRSEQDALAATIPGAELLVRPGAGHSLHWERPERFAADLAAYVTG